MKRLLFILLLAIFGFAVKAEAQQVALKTNALYWATTTPNLGLEVGLGKRTTIEIMGGYNPFTLNKELNQKVKHWSVMPEFRYWFCERFQGHHLGLHTGYMFYNVGAIRIPSQPVETKYNRYQGWGVGAGVAYGYALILGKHWNLEFELGVGYIYSGYDVFECSGCGRRVGSDSHHYFGLTKAAVNLVYLF